MSEAYHLYVISFTVGKEAGLALVAAQDEKSAFQILKNGGSRHCEGYSLVQIRDIGMTTNCTYGLLLESFVNAKEAYDAILRAANKLRGVRGPSMYEEAVEKGYTGTEEEWLEEHTGPQGEKGDKGDKGDRGDKGDKGDIGPAVPVIANLESDSNTDALAASQGKILSGRISNVERGLVGGVAHLGDIVGTVSI